MEDVRIGRRTKPSQSFGEVGTSGGLIVPFSTIRVSLVIFPPDTTSTTIKFGSNPSASGDGFRMAVSHNPLILNIQDHGAMVYGPWHGIVAAGTEQIHYVESSLVDE